MSGAHSGAFAAPRRMNIEYLTPTELEVFPELAKLQQLSAHEQATQP